jgi:DNA polymerase-3 subunit delta'
MAEAAEAPPHPREVFDYARGEVVEKAFLEALDRGRLHHAWMLTGPEGIGKATFAYRAARRLLGARPDPAFGRLGCAPDDPEARLIAARAHPDLLVLERRVEDGKLKKFIAVDDARELPEFFSKAPSRSGFRVAIVDAADDMNVNAANALLKTLEEPPERGVVFLVAHAPGRLMATIRSRCRRLAFAPWPLPDVAEFLRRRTGLDDGDVADLARMAAGAPGRALQLAASEVLTLDVLARDLVLGRRPTPSALVKIADGFRSAEGQARFELLFQRLAEAVRARATAQPPPAGLERWAGLWDRLSAAPAQAEAVNLDRADLFWSSLAELDALSGGA